MKILIIQNYLLKNKRKNKKIFSMIMISLSNGNNCLLTHILYKKQKEEIFFKLLYYFELITIYIFIFLCVKLKIIFLIPF